jgi:hypothetical protein
MTDYTLRFPNEATACKLIGSALNANCRDEEGSDTITRFTTEYAIDLIGILTKPALIAPDGIEIKPARILPGWHVNLRFLKDRELPAELVPYIVTPFTPSRVWF